MGRGSVWFLETESTVWRHFYFLLNRVKSEKTVLHSCSWTWVFNPAGELVRNASAQAPQQTSESNLRVKEYLDYKQACKAHQSSRTSTHAYVLTAVTTDL